MGRSFALACICPRAVFATVGSATRAAHPRLKSEHVGAVAHTVETGHASEGQELFAAPEKIPEPKGKQAKRKEANGLVDEE